ncbi:MAG TPA: YtpI family protein [Pseudogracilibacillus sp.]|nr:YtpI family protein [Pseudogracilibacillus sp.]
MLIFAILIVISIVMYIYYKVAILKTKETLLQKYQNAKARIFLGIFLISFAINQYIAVQIKTILIISIIFIFLGVLQLVDGYKQAKHYRNEWRRLNPEQ